MLCFIFRKNILRGRRCGIVRFCWVFEGGLEKAGGWTWFFDGKNVVRCVVKRGGKTAFAQALKICHFFQLYFELAADWFAGGRGKADFSTPLLTEA
jgi:hypothetical protein